MKVLKNGLIALKKIFEREHLIRTFWGVVTAGIFFLIGIWYNGYKGPSKVEIINNPKAIDTVIVRFNKDVQSPEKLIDFYFNEISKQLTELKRQQNKVSNDRNYLDNHAINSPQIPDVKIKDSRLELSQKQKVVETVSVNAELRIPKYNLPPGKKGYVNSSLSGLAKISISNTSFAANSEIIISLNLLDESLLKKVTPVFISILHKNSETSYTLLADYTYDLKSDKNIIKLLSDFGNGSFILRCGFYFLNDIQKEYPDFYSKDFTITVH